MPGTRRPFIQTPHGVCENIYYYTQVRFHAFTLLMVLIKYICMASKYGLSAHYASLFFSPLACSPVLLPACFCVHPEWWFGAEAHTLSTHA